MTQQRVLHTHRVACAPAARQAEFSLDPPRHRSPHTAVTPAISIPPGGIITGGVNGGGGSGANGTFGGPYPLVGYLRARPPHRSWREAWARAAGQDCSD